MSPPLRHILALFLLLACAFTQAVQAETPREIIARAIVAEDAETQAAIITTLAGQDTPEIRELLTLWRQGGIFLYDSPEGTRMAVIPADPANTDVPQAIRRLDTNEPLPIPLLVSDLTLADTDSNLRKAMKSVLDLGSLGAPDSLTRRTAVGKLGMEQKASHLPALRARQSVEKDPAVLKALREAIALTLLRSDSEQEQLDACRDLLAIRSMASKDALSELEKEALESRPAVAAAARKALVAVETHTKWVNLYNTLFFGLSAGSVLLVVAVGLAITFGVMGVINMAHGELIAVGAYTTYLLQHVFGAGLALSPFGIATWIPGLNLQGTVYDCFFLAALPLSFLTAAGVGVLLERGIIQFLYRRPLESLLATWGVSLVLQQLFKLIFGSNNVQVYSPRWLSGNWTFFDVALGWNRLFVIAFAVLIIVGTWLVLNRTPLGLLIRAVMQNSSMASCLGVRTSRVNMLTFAFGSGLAGLAGAFLSQISNVGPSMGQSYIVDAFMTVVVGGVGNLLGTVISAIGIGVLDQSLQQILLNPVLGKILVLAGIVLFLQWRPAGLFVTKSRSLEG